ncbi:hypothetical protein CK478_02365 [Enterobacter hormaechei]|nr:hypothetical protein CK478_02365 [Enterobacter hormaechei]
MSNTAEIINFPNRTEQPGGRMADLSNGYTKVANEIQELKPRLRMSGREWQCFEAVIWLTYGWNKKQDRVTNTVIAELIETIIGLAALVISAIAGAFGLGHIRGTSKAEAKADQQRTKDNAAATVAAAERRVEATKEASNVQQTVNHMSDDDVDRELRDNWTRKG